MKIRKASIDDFEALKLLLKQLTYVGNPDITEIPESIYNNIYVIVNEEQILGCVTLLLEDKIIHDGSKVAHIEDVVVDKKCRGLGLGKQLINHCINISKSEGCYKILLDCDKNNIGFYGSMGFKTKGVCMRFDC